MAHAPKSLTVAELREMLEFLDDDLEVVFAYNYGDYWRTTVAGTFSNVEEGYVTYSDYHRMNKVVEDDGEEDVEENEKVRRVVVLG